MKDAVQVLEELREEIHKEFEHQDARADRRLEQGKCVSGADGQCTGLEKALKFIESKLRDLRIDAQNDTAVYMVRNTPIKDETLKFAQMMELLHAGKRVRVKNRCYTGLYVPHLKFADGMGYNETLKLDCCRDHDYGTIKLSKPMKVDSVAVIGYEFTGQADKIEYVYANPQMNRLFAHLENGKDVDYDFDILSVWSAFDGEWEEPRRVTLQFFKVNEDGHRKFYAEEKCEFPIEWRVDQIVDDIKNNETRYKEMDVYLAFQPNDEIGYPCFIAASERKYGAR